MTAPHPPGGGPLADDGAARLDRLRDRFRGTVPDRPDGLGELRPELEAFRSEAVAAGRPGSARAFDRLALMTEVWECLAAEGHESAGAAAGFCGRALEHLATARRDRRDDDGTSWILRESSECWSDYLGLIDPSTAVAPVDRDDQAPGADRVDCNDADDDDNAEAEPPPPAIDAETLLRMLTGAVPSAGIPEPERPSSRPDTAPSAEVEAAPEWEIDAECREAFLAEALDLFERIETLVVHLSRGGDHEGTLTELSRCFHTLKGAAGSVGLIGFVARVHQLEEGLEAAAGRSSPALLDQLHQALGHMEVLLAALRQGAGPGHGSCPEDVPVGGRREPHPEAPRAASPHWPADEGLATAVEEPPPTEPAEGPVRIPSGRMDELMDLASELIMRRGAWAAQAQRLKEFASSIRGCRNELQTRLDRLDELGLRGAERREAGGRPGAGGDHPARGGVDASSDLVTVVLRLAEQVEDLVVLTEAVQAQALPLADDSDTLARLTLQLWEALQSIRIVPIRGLFQRLARVAHDAARIEGRSVEVVMVGEETGLDRAVQDKAFEPLLHIVRNAVGHGIEAPADRAGAGKPAVGRVALEASREGNTLVLSVEDDGRGLDYAAIADKGRRLGLLGPDEVAGAEQLGSLIFRSGFSTRAEANAISGRGVGMDVVAQEVRRLRGTIDLTSRAGAGTRITLRLPARLALEQAMIARVAGQALAIPIGLIEHAQPFEPDDVDGTGCEATVQIRDRRVPLIVAREVLGFSATPPASCPKLLLVRAEGEALALLFDAIEGTRELVIKPLGPLLAGHPVIWGTSLSATGETIFVLNPPGLHRWLCEGRAAAVALPVDPPASRPAPVLVVDDSISVRRVVSRQLRMLGLEVEEVSDGVEALAKLSRRPYCMVLTDLEMPRMDGFELLAELRRSPALAALPVIVASTESRLATRRRVLALGARAFLAKPIDQEELARVAGAVLNRTIGQHLTAAIGRDAAGPSPTPADEGRGTPEVRCKAR